MFKSPDDAQYAKQSDASLQRDPAPTPDSIDKYATSHVAQNATAPSQAPATVPPPEHGGQAGLEPTRYGDWEKKGRCTDF